MKVYTRTGDRGETALFGSGRVSKSDPRVAAYGDVDELNAWLGVAASLVESPLIEVLEAVQRDLFAVGAILATPDPERRKGDKFTLDEGRIAVLESQIDVWDETLPPLKAFVLPGGDRAAALLHAARTVCRRAERTVVGLDAEDIPPHLVSYLNRLSDWLFVCARYVNHERGVSEPTW